MNKTQIRNKILKVRKKFNSNKFEIKFSSIINVLKKNKINGKIVGGYYPYNYEVDIIEILKKFENKNYLVTLPRIKKNHQMNFFSWSTNDPLLVNNLGIPEPTSTKIAYPDILLVPLVAYDKDLNRIGYGGGYYDRFINRLKKKKRIFIIGIAFSFQRVKKIKTNKFDMKLDAIITEKKN